MIVFDTDGVSFILRPRPPAGLIRRVALLAEPELRIAATCLRFGAELATGNLRHFARVPGLEVSDWLAEDR